MIRADYARVGAGKCRGGDGERDELHIADTSEVESSNNFENFAYCGDRTDWLELKLEGENTRGKRLSALRSGRAGRDLARCTTTVVSRTAALTGREEGETGVFRIDIVKGVVWDSFGGGFFFDISAQGWLG